MLRDFCLTARPPLLAVVRGGEYLLIRGHNIWAVREAQARQRAASAKRKRDSAQPPRSASATARSLREAQARQRAASAKRKRDSAQPPRSASATARSLREAQAR